jgi:hypothetical protein
MKVDIAPMPGAGVARVAAKTRWSLGACGVSRFGVRSLRQRWQRASQRLSVSVKRSVWAPAPAVPRWTSRAQRRRHTTSTLWARSATRLAGFARHAAPIGSH